MLRHGGFPSEALQNPYLTSPSGNAEAAGISKTYERREVFL
jgi:hypothetical protein